MCLKSLHWQLFPQPDRARNTQWVLIKSVKQKNLVSSKSNKTKSYRQQLFDTHNFVAITTRSYDQGTRS
jgi:hypothetical protein